MATTGKPILSKQAFWDVDMEKIDYQKNARHVVEKVIERGSAKDFKNLINYYGFEGVKQLALQALSLSPVSIHFCCTQFELNPTQFKCYEKRHLNREYWEL
jgi:hypothetical protein